MVTLMLLTCRSRSPWDWATAALMDAATLLWLIFLVGLL